MIHEFGFIDHGHRYIYRYALDRLDKLALALAKHACRKDHPMTWTLAWVVIEDARLARASALDVTRKHFRREA